MNGVTAFEHQKDRQRSERDALRQRKPGNRRSKPGLMGGDLLDPRRHQRGRQRQKGRDRREADHHLDYRDDRVTQGIEKRPVEEGHGYILKGFLPAT
jgi:hypothetical protein